MHLAEEVASSYELSGFGNSLCKIRMPYTGEIIAFIGQQEDQDKVFFPRAQPIDVVIAVGELLSKKQIKNAVDKQD